jgi:hypothetical protein
VRTIWAQGAICGFILSSLLPLVAVIGMASGEHRAVPSYFDMVRQAPDGDTNEGATKRHQGASSTASGEGSVPHPQRLPLTQAPASSARSQMSRLTTLRQTCPSCRGQLVEARHRSKFAEHGVRAIVVAAPDAYLVEHCAKTCVSCAAPTKFWHGYYEVADDGDNRKWRKHLDSDFLPDAVWMANKSFGVHPSWACKWRYSLYSHRTSFLGEGHILRALQPDTLPSELDNMLLDAWVRWQVWRRACEAGASVAVDTADKILEQDIESLLKAITSWYAPLMKNRRLQAWRSSGDRRDILCFDGNAKLHRRTCGAPCAETVFIECLGLHLVRGCPESPEQQGVLCPAHAALRSQGELAASIAKHRMVQALSTLPFYALEVQLAGYAPRWQPASTVDSQTFQAIYGKCPYKLFVGLSGGSRFRPRRGLPPHGSSHPGLGG